MVTMQIDVEKLNKAFCFLNPSPITKPTSVSTFFFVLKKKKNNPGISQHQNKHLRKIRQITIIFSY